MKLETEDIARPFDREPLALASTPGELDLFPFLIMLRSRLWLITGCTVLGLVIAAIYANTRKPRYEATASILIPQQNTPSAANQALQAATGLNLLGGGFEVYLDILHSRNVQDRLIDQFHLEDHYRVHSIEATESELFQRTTAVVGKEGLLLVTVQDEDPKTAADLANAYFTVLSQLNAHLGITAASQLRRFYEGEMIHEKDALADAEVALEQSQQKTGVLEPQQQASAEMGAEESTRAQLRARQIELQGLLQGATPANPNVVRLQSQIAGLEAQLNAFQSTGGPGEGTPASRQPQQALDYIRKQREVKFHEALLDMITRQFDQARQQESKDISMLEVLDAARTSPFPSWPNRWKWTLIGGVVGLGIGLLLAGLQAIYVVLMSNPINRRRIHQLIRGTATA